MSLPVMLVLVFVSLFGLALLALRSLRRDDQARLKDGTRRITHITEVDGMEGPVVTLQDLFLFDYHAGVDEQGRFRGTLRPTGLRPHFLDTLADHGIPVPPGIFGSGDGRAGEYSRAGEFGR